MGRFPGNRRRNYFIDKKFQSQFILNFCLIILCASLLIGTCMYALNKETTTVAFENLRVVVKTTADFILPITIQVLVVVTIVAALTAIVMALFTSHRIAGPLFNIKREIGKMRAGNLASKIRIRTTDQLQALAKECDGLREMVHDSLSMAKDKLKEIDVALEKTADSDEKKRIKEAIDAIREEFGHYKTK